jgi:hypothetical protein
MSALGQKQPCAVQEASAAWTISGRMRRSERRNQLAASSYCIKRCRSEHSSNNEYTSMPRLALRLDVNGDTAVFDNLLQRLFKAIADVMSVQDGHRGRNH